MSSNKHDMTDFDVSNYPIEDLFAIMGILDQQPFTKAEIIDETQKYIDKYENDPLFKRFFFDVRTRLLKEKDYVMEDNVFTFKKEDEEEDVIVGDRYEKTSGLIDDEHLVIGEIRQKSTGGHDIPFVQGDNNPTKRYTVTRIVNFDSHYRTILDPSSVACPVADPNSNQRLDTPTNYTANLSQPLQNVIEITLENAEIPSSWYVFNSEYGTNYYCTNQQADPFSIPSGNYSTSTLLIQELNNASTDLLFSYNSLTNKISVQNNSAAAIIIEWYKPITSLNLCVDGGGVGQKLDCNLGWQLGFRLESYTLQPNHTITGEAILDLHGPKYLLISLDDFQNSKPNQDIISIRSNKSNFSLPSYYNKNTMDPGCDPPNYNAFYQSCSTRPVNYDLSRNLTQKQLYSVDQLKLAMTGKPADRYSSPNSTDILHKVPILRNIQQPYGNISYINAHPDLSKRIYFGPVNLSSFRIRLLNDKGLVVNLNNMDWSFSIRVTQIYSY
tara:strand:+ start:5808 stop:7298 length:1491 start_codon:yes stop_codon:yes gene_type:complete